MSIRTRKLIGTVALLVLIALWALLAMALAQFALRSASEIVVALYYVIAGLGWVLPAMPLVAWMQKERPMQQETKQDDHALGSTCVRPPAGDTCVIFVHGILSGGKTAWTADNGVSWPQLLEQETEFYDVGIYVFSYRADTLSRTYTIDDAVDAVRELIHYEKLLERRRLIFVAHSMGGIIVRRFLVRYANDLIDRDSIIGLLLVASPSLGSEDATTLGLINTILGNTQLQDLRLSQDNTWLNGLDQDFRGLRDSRRLSIVGKELVEDETITIKKFLLRSDQIVKWFSASRYFADSVKIPNSDHMSISKPADRNALQHQVLISFIREVLKAGPSDRTRKIAEQADINALADILRARAQTYVELLDKVVAKLTAEGGMKSPETKSAIERLCALRAEFLQLHEKHLAALSESKRAVTHETLGEIHELQEEVAKLVEAASGTISAAIGRSLRRRYIRAPEPGIDRAYDEARREMDALHEETVGRVRIMTYPGDVPAGIPTEIAQLAFPVDAQGSVTKDGPK